MCGLVGAAGKLTLKHDKFFKTALILDTLRGIDSTGAAIIKSNGDVKVVKRLGHAFELLESGKFNTALNGVRNNVLLGHNRYATQGAVNAGNAHPYEFDTLVGAHNGTLKNKWELGAPHNQHPVDSYCLYSHMDEKGPEETISKIDGAWALTWYDTVQDRLCMIRNKERPLFIAYEEKNESVLWASEPWMITVAAERAELKIQRPFEIEVDTLISWDIDEKGGLTEVQSKKIVGKQTFFPVATYARGGTKSGAANNQSVTPTGKVFEFPGAEASPASFGTGYKIGYSTTKDVELEVVGQGKDEHGARYLICFDPESPTIRLRLYIPHSTDFTKYDGKVIIGTIGKYHFKPGQASNGYYKVEYSTHKMKIDKEHKECYNHNQELISEEEWTNQYGSCQWCTAAIFPDDVGTRFADIGNGEIGAICGDCVKDEEVGKYVRFK